MAPTSDDAGTHSSRGPRRSDSGTTTTAGCGTGSSSSNSRGMAWRRQQEPGLTHRDPADARARFWLARSRDGALIGAVRVCAVADVFPHEELFAHHLAVPAVAAIRPRLGTLNSLLVERGWRRTAMSKARTAALGTVASLLLEACVSGCADRGAAGDRRDRPDRRLGAGADACRVSRHRPAGTHTPPRRLHDVQCRDRAEADRHERPGSGEVFRCLPAARAGLADHRRVFCRHHAQHPPALPDPAAVPARRGATIGKLC